MSIYMDDFSVAGGPEGVKKGIRKCVKVKIEKQLKQNKIYGSKDRQRKGRRYFRISERRFNIQRTKKYKYLRVRINEEGNLKGHIEESKQKCETMCRKNRRLNNRKSQVGKK